MLQCNELLLLCNELFLHCRQCRELRHLLVNELKLPLGRFRCVVRELLVQIRPQPEHYRNSRSEEPSDCRSDPDQHIFVDDDSKGSELQGSW